MNKRQFWTMAIFTALETYFFNDAVMRESYLAAIFWALLILRNLQVSYILGKLINSLIRKNEISIKNKHQVVLIFYELLALFYRSHCLREISPLLSQRSLPSVSWTSSCPLSEISLARPW